MGTGEARIESIRIETTRLGRDRRRRAALDLDRPRAARPLSLEGVQLDLEIHDSIGSTFVTLAKDLSAEQPLGLGAGRSTLTCRISELPLRPGAYTVSATLSRAGDDLDRAPKKGTFTLVASDFFGTGEVTRDDRPGPVLVRHGWSIRRGQRVRVLRGPVTAPHDRDGRRGDDRPAVRSRMWRRLALRWNP